MSLIKDPDDGFYHPDGEDEVIALVQRAREQGLTLRVRGSGHSVAHAIYTDPLDGIDNRTIEPGPPHRVPGEVATAPLPAGPNLNLLLDENLGYCVLKPEERLIEVDAGMDLRTLFRELSECHGWMLAGTGGIAHQTVAGFTATGSAGGSLQRSVNDSIEGFRLIDGTGRRWDVDRGDPAFPAMVPNLGLLGVVTKVRLRCIRAFTVVGHQATTAPADAEVVLLGPGHSERPSLRDFLTDTPYARVEWWPQRNAQRVVVWKAKPAKLELPYDPNPLELFRAPTPYLAQALIGVVYTVLGNLDDRDHMVSELDEVVAQIKRDDRLPAELICFLKTQGRLGEQLAHLLEQWFKPDTREAIASRREAVEGLSIWIPKAFPMLLRWFLPVDSPRGCAQPFDDHAWRGLAMDDVVDDVYMPVEFTEIWVPMRRTDEVMRLLHQQFDLLGDPKLDDAAVYEHTGTFAIELYATKPNGFWMNPAYTSGRDEWADGALRINPFWYCRNAGHPADEFFPRLWELLRANGIPYRLHWGKFLPRVERDRGWARYIQGQYPRWQAFMNLRAERDPDGIFLSEYWREHLGISTPPKPIADLHCHYPMRLLADRSKAAIAARRRCRGAWWWLDGMRAFAVRSAARMMSLRGWSASWRVTFDRLERAPAGLVLSVLYDPASELLVRPGRQLPRRRAFRALVCQLDDVEAELRRIDRYNQRHVIVRTLADLDRTTGDGRMAFVHCVEGGFHLGPEPEMIDAQVAELARRGVAYITPAHLFYRGVATNTPALPFMSDARYHKTFPQHGRGLSKDLGRAMIEAMYRHGILVDIIHMDDASLADTFKLLDDLDRAVPGNPTDAKAHPIIASHAGYRFGDQDYMLDEATIREIQRRDGVIGLILARHQLDDGLCAEGETTPGFEALRHHIQTIYDITGTHDHTCIGSDLDGFIKPTVGAIETANHLGALEPWLRCTFPDAANAILFDNAKRVVRQAFALR